MKKLKEGDKSRAICPECKEVVHTTFRFANFDREGKVFNVLQGFCDRCNEVVALPHQSVEEMNEYEKKLQ